MYEHFRATGAHEAEQGLSDSFSISLQSDDVQDFDVRWDEARLSASEVPPDAILEGLFKKNCRTLFSFRLFWLCMTKKLFEIMGKLFTIEDVCKTSR